MPPHEPRSRLPRTVVVLGAVSFLMDTSSEMVHAVLPVFLVAVVGATPLVIGVIEGLAESLALMVKVLSGYWSDRSYRRKPLIMAGYGLAALSKPLFALAPGVGLVLGARLLDRTGKGLRGAPRDALIADVTPVGRRGAAFGLRQSMDTAGAVAGPLLAMLLLWLSSEDFRFVFWIAALPAAACVVLLWLGVRESRRDSIDQARLAGSLSGLGGMFWLVVLVGFVFQLARFSEAFLLLRAEQLGWTWVAVPLVLVVVNIAYALTAYPAGALSDRFGRKRLLLPAIVLLVLADLAFAKWNSPLGLLVGAALWGAHMGLSAGVLAAFVTDSAPALRRGLAFGVFNFVSGVALFAASVVAGALWQLYSAAIPFYAGAIMAVLAGLLVLLLPAHGTRRVAG
ncbi:MAG: MFS transporter [Gammaproteobacteria bacterium]|nr:MFS transporter [Gammaproteobacteria bacterium]